MQEEDKIYSCDDEAVDIGMVGPNWTYAVWFDVFTRESNCRPNHLLDVEEFGMMPLPKNWTHG